MSAKELQDAFKLRFDDAGKLVYMLPQDIIDNTVRAFSVSATSATGYSDQGVPTGRYMAPANGPDCIEIAQSQHDQRHRRLRRAQLVVTGPTLVRFDLSTSQADRDQGQHELRVPRRDPERVQHAVVRSRSPARPTTPTRTRLLPRHRRGFRDGRFSSSSAATGKTTAHARRAAGEPLPLRLFSCTGTDLQ